MERYQHNLEHGCIVLLYHPCLEVSQVRTLSKMLDRCVRKYVSTPSRLPSLSHPVIMIGWGCYQEFSTLDMRAMKDFIRSHARTGPEGKYAKDGLYTHLQTKIASVKEIDYIC